MKRRLILHLGLWKTGTKTIQTFLRGNPEALAEEGIYYPKVFPDNPDHPITKASQHTALLRDEVHHRALAHELKGRPRKPDVDPSRTPLWSTAFRRFAESGADTAIVSWEDFSARPEAYPFDILKPRLATYNVLGVIYLRHQEDWAVSLYAHMVRGGLTDLSFDDFIRSITDRIAYSRLLDRIIATIPMDRLVVGDFNKATASGLLEDFFDKAELPRGPLAAADREAAKNRSPPYWVLLFLIRCRQAAISEADFELVRGALTGQGVRTIGPMLRPGLDLASPTQRQSLRDAATTDAERLFERYAIRLSASSREPVDWRPFDAEDFITIRDAIASRISPSARDALRDAC